MIHQKYKISRQYMSEYGQNIKYSGWKPISYVYKQCALFVF
jgi:hypothetical protein